MLSDKSMCLHLSQGRVSRQVCASPSCAAHDFLYRSLPSSLHVLRPPCIAFGLVLRTLCLSSDLWRLRSCLPAESSMNGRERPCENSTTNTAILPLGYAFRQEYVLAPISGESFSAGLLPAKITEVRAKEGLCLSLSRSDLPSDLSAVAHRELHERHGLGLCQLPHFSSSLIDRVVLPSRAVHV